MRRVHGLVIQYLLAYQPLTGVDRLPAQKGSRVGYTSETQAPPRAKNLKSPAVDIHLNEAHTK